MNRVRPSPACGSMCVYFQQAQRNESRPVKTPRGQRGQCRRHLKTVALWPRDYSGMAQEPYWQARASTEFAGWIWPCYSPKWPCGPVTGGFLTKSAKQVAKSLLAVVEVVASKITCVVRIAVLKTEAPTRRANTPRSCQGKGPSTLCKADPILKVWKPVRRRGCGRELPICMCLSARTIAATAISPWSPGRMSWQGATSMPWSVSWPHWANHSR